MTVEANLRQYAKSYDWNGVIFFLMPYRLMETETAIAELSEVEPQTVYVNKKTQERVYDKPSILEALEERAAKITDAVNSKIDAMKIAPEKAQGMREKAQKEVSEILASSAWETRDLWHAIHRCFVICESITVAIDFPEGGKISTEVAALQDYWLGRSSNVLERWQVFKALMSTNVCNAWWDAFYATRDGVLPASPGLTGEVGKNASDEEKNAEPAPSLAS